MTDKKELPEKASTHFEFEAPPKKRPFLGSSTRDSKGRAVFPEIGAKASFICVAVEPFVKNEKAQPALILEDKNGVEYIRVLGKTNQYQLGELGYTSTDGLLNQLIELECYDTGSSGEFAIGLRIVSVSKPSK